MGASIILEQIILQPVEQKMHRGENAQKPIQYYLFLLPISIENFLCHAQKLNPLLIFLTLIKFYNFDDD